MTTSKPQATDTARPQGTDTAFRFSKSICFTGESGGDFPRRFENGFRVALGSALIFTILVGTKQQFLPSAWLGNVFFLVAWTFETFGAGTIFVIIYSRDILITTLLAWAGHELCNSFGAVAFETLIPIVTGILTFFIMSCPWITYKNYMLLIMFSNLSSLSLVRFYALKTVVTCLFGCTMALFVMFIPFPQSLTSNNAFDKLTKNILTDTRELLLGLRSYSLTTGVSISDAHRAINVIELAAERLDNSCKKIKKYAASAEFERTLVCRMHYKRSFVKWAEFVNDQQEQVDMMRRLVTANMLGERENLNYNKNVRDAQAKLGSFLLDSVRELVSVSLEAMEICSRSIIRRTMPSVTIKNETEIKLYSAIEEFTESWDAILPEVEETVLSTEYTSVTSFAFLVRRMTLSFAINTYCSHLATFLKNIDMKESSPRMKVVPKLRAYILRPWPRTLKGFHMPIKTTLSMMIASLFVAIPVLREETEPFSTWPAITVAVITLGDTGSSYMKSLDRLWGTLLASAYALLLVFFADVLYFDLHAPYIKIPCSTLFTFVAIYLSSEARPYVSICASFTLSNILYGSIKTGYDIEGYIAERIALVMMGIIIFMAVELLLSPTRSREVVQEKCLIFFTKAKEFLELVDEAMESIGQYHPPKQDIPVHPKDSVVDIAEKIGQKRLSIVNADKWQKRLSAYQVDSARKLRSSMAELDATQQVEDMMESLAAITKIVMKAKRELSSAINEPSFGFSFTLDQPSFTGLVEEQLQCEKYMNLLLNVIKGMQDFYMSDLPDNHPFRNVEWPTLYSDMVKLAIDELGKSCQKLSLAFPDGKIRPQKKNLIDAMEASVSFRNFQAVKLKALSMWSEQYQTVLLCRNFEGFDVPHVMMIVKLGLAADHILEIFRHFEHMGEFFEMAVRRYPRLPYDDEVKQLENILSLSPNNMNTHVKHT